MLDIRTAIQITIGGVQVFLLNNLNKIRSLSLATGRRIPFVRRTIETTNTRLALNQNTNDYTLIQNQKFQGGCLRSYLKAWQALGANQFILKVITAGRIPFKAKPPMQYPRAEIIDRFSTKLSREMTRTVKKLKEQRILEKPLNLNPGFHSKMFLVRKSDGSLRPIFDLRGLNQHVKVKHFSLISQADVVDFIQPEDWLVKLDIHQAYFHLPISKGHRRYLRIIYNQEILQLTALPFGLASSPRTFAAVTSWVAERLRSRGIRVLVYLDDFLLCHQSRSILVSQVSETLQILTDLGWQINFQKSQLNPTQELEYLGLVWNSATNLKALPASKVHKIRIMVSNILEKECCSLKQVQILLGLLNFANLTTPRGRIHCRRIQIFLRSFREDRPRQRRLLPYPVYLDLRWWQDAIAQSTVALHKKPITHFLTTDAADVGWGAQLNEHYLTGAWQPAQVRWHSNLKEMFAVYGAISRQKASLRNAHILVQTDNRTLVAYLRDEGGTRSLALLNLTFSLLELADHLSITLSAAYLPGRYNGIADRLSRNRPVPEWHLLPQASGAIFRKWGVPDVDLFASRRSAVVRRYVTWDSRDGLASFCDAFSRTWHCRLGWLFPPPNLIPRVLRHLNSAKGKYVLIAPHWTQCAWLPDVRARALEEPVPIPDLCRNLIDLTTRMNPPQVDKLHLMAWKVGGGPVRLLNGLERKGNC